MDPGSPNLQHEAEATIPREVLTLLRTAHTEHGCLIWWRHANRNLAGQAPEIVWATLHRHLVLREAQRVADGNSE